MILDPLGAWVAGRFNPLAPPRVKTDGSGPDSPPVLVPLLAEATASAVVGVDRRPPPAPADDPLGWVLAGHKEKESPTRLLAVAAAASLYGRAGRKQVIDATPDACPCPPDNRPACPPEAVRWLCMILGGEHADLTGEWIECLGATVCVLPHESLIDVLELPPLAGPVDRHFEEDAGSAMAMGGVEESALVQAR